MSDQRAKHVVTFILAVIVIIFASFMFKANQKIMQDIADSSVINKQTIPTREEKPTERRSAKKDFLEMDAVNDQGATEQAALEPVSVPPKKPRVIYEMPINEDALVQ